MTVKGDRCFGCKAEIVWGEARYTAEEPDKHWHYQCHQDSIKAARPKVDAVVIQVAGNFGGWSDLHVAPDVRTAMALVSNLRQTKKRSEFRIIKVIST